MKKIAFAVAYIVLAFLTWAYIRRTPGLQGDMSILAILCWPLYWMSRFSLVLTSGRNP